jgi:DNA polymerase-3 subunit epsilon
MGLIKKDAFICLDCESTGLDTKNDRIIEVAAICFTFDGHIEKFESLVNPQCKIPKESQLIHNISDEMVEGMPTIDKVLPKLFSIIENYIIVGHGISFDISLIEHEAKRIQMPYKIDKAVSIDTLRMGRLYGECPIVSLEKLREHFNIPEEGAHRAMNDVVVNIEVFKKLSKSFQTTEQLLQRLKKPIALKAMPLGRHKGRKFAEVPIEYLQWAVNKNFDDDLLYSIKQELKIRRKKNSFYHSSNPFAAL